MTGHRIYFSMILLGIAFFPYTKTPMFSYLFFIVFILSIGIKLLLSEKQLLDYESFALPLLLFCTQLILLVVQGTIRVDFNFLNAGIDTIQRIMVVITFIIILSNTSLVTVTRVFDTILCLFFCIGLFSLAVFHGTGTALVNENSLGFFLFPYLGFQLYNRKRLPAKVVIYIFGITLLYLTEGRASLLAFSLTPFWLWIINKPFPRKVFPVLFLLISCTIPFAFMDILLQYDKELSGRGSLQYAYALHLKEDVTSLVFGTGEFVLKGESIAGLGPHHTWLGLLFTYGIVGLLVNILFILYCMNCQQVNSRSKLYLLILLYLFTVQNFENINIGGISYMSLLLLSCLFLLRKSRYALDDNETCTINREEGVRKSELLSKHKLYHL